MFWPDSKEAKRKVCAFIGIILVLVLACVLLIYWAVSNPVEIEIQPAKETTGTDSSRLPKLIEPRLMGIDELQQIIEAMESAYIDISVDYTWHYDPAPAVEEIAGKGLLIPVGKEQRTFTTARPFSDRSLSSDKITFMTEHGDTFDSESKESYNGSIAKHFHIGGWPKSTMTGTITKRKDFMKTSGTPLKFSVFYFHPHLALSEWLKNTESCRINSEIVKINDCNSISVEMVTSGGHIYRRIYFSIDHDYTPVRFEFIKGGKVSRSIDVFKFQEVSKGLWFPVKGQIKAEGIERVNVYEAKTVIVNQGLTVKDFDFEFPPGTRIRDEITGQKYIIRPTEE